MLTDKEKTFLTTWLFEIGMKPVFFWAGKVHHPATWRLEMQRLREKSNGYINQLVEEGYLMHPNESRVLMLTQKAIDALGETDDIAR